jgi:hypothetical protein
MNEQEYLKLLADEAHDTVDFLSSRRKAERERRACAAFLRCLGVCFSPDELVTPERDPPDLIFRDACFEVMLVLDEGRKMHAESKKEAVRRDLAESLDDLIQPYHPSQPISFMEVVDRVIADLHQKASHYGAKTCSQLDALVYVNYEGKHLSFSSEANVPGKLQNQDWRSASFLFPPYSHVLFTLPKAPNFLRSVEGISKQECGNPDVWFDL